MLGHLVSNSRQAPPDFGVAFWLREAAGRLQHLPQHLSRRLLSLLPEAGKQPHPQ
ncbi:MAG TPA: hypothetical protein VN175_04090 [Rhizomicrobium sp.]|jgi:hypothetical protein|nr:hypothetical protein [Rhizomicrobium sp.]